MNLPPLVDPGRIEIRLDRYGIAPSTALSDSTIPSRIQDYRRRIGTRMYPIDVDDIRRKLPPAEYFVSRKLDGEFAVLLFRDGQAAAINPIGSVFVGLPWLDEAAELLSQAGISQAMIAGEHYVQLADRRSRIHDLLELTGLPGSKDKLLQLQFAAFDVLEIDGQGPSVEYADTWRRLTDLLGNGTRVKPVETRVVAGPVEVQHCFRDMVESEGSEGIVARSDSAGLFKIKPRVSIDAVVVGYTEGTEDRLDMVQDLLLALAREDGSLQILCRLSYGFSDDERRQWLEELRGMQVESEYAEVNSDHVAFRMVKPEWVLEISCLDMVSQTTRGGPVNRMVLHWDQSKSKFEIIRRMPLVSVIAPQLVRRRLDKSADPFDIRIQQVAGVVDVPQANRDAKELTLPKSELLRREVHAKQLRGATMIRKLLMWKTNKETQENEEFPGYVLYFTDFSPNRKVPLQRDIRISNSREQIEQLWDILKEDKIKKGCILYSSHSSIPS